MRYGGVLKLRGSTILPIAVLLCNLFLIYPVQCSIDIHPAADGYLPDFRYPSAFHPEDNITIKWHYDYAKTLDSYRISVKYQDQTEKWGREFNLNYKTPGQGSPIDGSQILGKLDEGTYFASISSRPNDGEPDMYSEPFSVSPRRGNLTIKIIDRSKNIGLAGWHLRIGKTGAYISEIRETTDENGVLFVPELAIGDYIVEEVPQEGWYSADAARKNVTIDNQKTANVEFNNIHAGSIRITKYADLNSNRVMDAKDYPISNGSFNITGDGFNQTVTTNKNGIATAFVRPGRYTITESPMDCWTTASNIGQTVEVKPSKTVAAYFGDTPMAELTLIGYEDRNSNGVLDEGEGISGVAFIISGPQNNQTLTAAENGSAALKAIPGEYTIKAISTSKIYSTDAGAQIVSLKLCDKRQATFPFGKIGTTINATAFLDSNKNGKYDSGEPSLQGLQIEIQNAQGTVKKIGPGITTVEPGTYIIRELKDAEWTITTPDSYTKSLSTGEGSDVQFGNYPHQSLVIFNYIDKNNDSRYDATTDQGLGGWDFTITDKTGNKKTVATNESGYAIIDLMPKMNYAVTSPAVGVWSTTTARYVNISTSSNPMIYRLEFGQYLPPFPQIQIFCFNDINHNGNRNSGEEGIPNCGFNITGPDGNRFLKTENDGWYNYSTGQPGDYIVEEIMPEGWSSTSDKTQEALNINRGVITQPLYFGIFKTPSSILSKQSAPECTPCKDEAKPVEASNLDLRVVKTIDPMVLNANRINADCGSAIKYNISLYPETKNAPTDAVILVDTSGSLLEITDEARLDIFNGITSFVVSEKENGVKNLRLSLITFDEASKILVPMTNDFDAIIAGANRISFNSENKTILAVGMNAAMDVLGGATSRAGSERVIVLITDAKGEAGQTTSQSLAEQGIKVNAIIIAGHEEMAARDMLLNLTATQGGREIDVNGSTSIREALKESTQMIAKSSLKGVKVAYTLPNYLTLNKSTLSKNATIVLNPDEGGWNTTTMTWDMASLDKPWSVTFDSVFCWDIPADAYLTAAAHLPISEVTYTNAAGVLGRLKIPEGEIRIRSAGKASDKSIAPLVKPLPRFESTFDNSAFESGEFAERNFLPAN